ncbi:hypothetical protein [Arenimonas sp. MALMAid1274]|uniref:hypothetical protein n=1 Tax=Arenimonas sp. MALMAid1274 TaxID=3411630 RepID=UPI003BA16183
MPSALRSARLLAASLCLLAGFAHAKIAPELRLELSDDATAAEFEARSAEILKALGDTQDYSELREHDRRRVKEALGRIGTDLSTVESLAQLPEAQRTAIRSEQDAINATLATARADSRMICVREQVIGSNRRRSVCLTAAQRRRDAATARGIVEENGS